MPTTLNINEILSEVKKLDQEGQLTILERLVAIISKNKDLPKRAKLSQISGIGSSLWSKQSIDDYISQERKW